VTVHVAGETRRIPAEWTPEHIALRGTLVELGIDPSAARPEWDVTPIVIEDVDGLPAGAGELREAAVTNCPPPRQ
jgi:hypothetical protein